MLRRRLKKSYFSALRDLPIKYSTIGEALTHTANYKTGDEALVEITRHGQIA